MKRFIPETYHNFPHQTSVKLVWDEQPSLDARHAGRWGLQMAEPSSSMVSLSYPCEGSATTSPEQPESGRGQCQGYTTSQIFCSLVGQEI